MRHKAPKSAGLFVFRLAKQKQKQKELKYLGLDVKQQIEPVNHHNVYVSCAWTCADVRKICTAPIKKNVATVSRVFGDSRTSWTVLTGHVSHDCDLAKGTEQGLHTESSSSIDLMMIITM